jgi:hypothetical protein
MRRNNKAKYMRRIIWCKIELRQNNLLFGWSCSFLHLSPSWEFVIDTGFISKSSYRCFLHFNNVSDQRFNFYSHKTTGWLFGNVWIELFGIRNVVFSFFLGYTICIFWLRIKVNSTIEFCLLKYILLMSDQKFGEKWRILIIKKFCLPQKEIHAHLNVHRKVRSLHCQNVDRVPEFVISIWA